MHGEKSGLDPELVRLMMWKAILEKPWLRRSSADPCGYYFNFLVCPASLTNKKIEGLCFLHRIHLN